VCDGGDERGVEFSPSTCRNEKGGHPSKSKMIVMRCNKHQQQNKGGTWPNGIFAPLKGIKICTTSTSTYVTTDEGQTDLFWKGGRRAGKQAPPPRTQNPNPKPPQRASLYRTISTSTAKTKSKRNHGQK
jgi:hypothetical protein